MSGPAKKSSVIVTGGGSGIGLAMSRHFASEGHSLAIFDVNAEAGAKIAGELSSEFPSASVTFRKCDVSSWEDQAAAFKDVYEKRGSIDIVMANAGISEQGSTTAVDMREDEPTEPHLGVIKVNMIGVIYSKFEKPPTGRCWTCFRLTSKIQSGETRLALHEQEERRYGRLAGLDRLHGFQCRTLPLPGRSVVRHQQIRRGRPGAVLGCAAAEARNSDKRPSACGSR